MSDPLPALSPEQTVQLTELARAMKAAARAVLLYPPTHPAIRLTVGRIADLTSTAQLSEPLKITVLPDNLLRDGKAPARPDQAMAELAAMLHGHLVGNLTMYPGGSAEDWLRFLLLIARTPEAVRADGGISRLWTTMAGRHVELREIDYAEVLRERAGGQAAIWERVIAGCLDGRGVDLDDATRQALADIGADARRLSDLVSSLEGGIAAGDGAPVRTAALLRLVRAVLDAAAAVAPDQAEPTLTNLAAAISQVSPDVMLELLSTRNQQPAETRPDSQLASDVVSRMPDHAVAHFVAQNVIAEGTATERLAQAFQALVPEGEQRHRLLTIARDEVQESPLGQAANFDKMWNNVSEMMTSYSDASFVSNAYGRELSGARVQAIEVERVADDPPDRIAVWLGSVAMTSVRTLDHLLLRDLLRIEQDASRWRDLTVPLISEVEDLTLVGDFEGAVELLDVLVIETGVAGTTGRRSSAAHALEQLVTGPMMRHIVAHLATIDDAQLARVQQLCLAIGPTIVGPLAEALSIEERRRTRERLTALLLAFGATGRLTVERLKNSSNAAVRRTAIYLLREFGGTEALPDLAALLEDGETQVQREAVRAILNIGTDEAYHVLQQALVRGTDASRNAMMSTLGSVSDERAAPLFAYILRHVDHRGRLGSIYLRAIEALATLRDPAGVEPLKEALYRGEWWAPRRTAILRGAAATALARIGTADALGVLQNAAISGGRGVRAAAHPHVTSAQSDGRASRP